MGAIKTKLAVKESVFMSDSGKKAADASLQSIGLTAIDNAYWNFSPAELIEEPIASRQGVLADNGVLAIETGEFTNRSPQDPFIVCDAITEDKVWRGKINQKFTPEKFASPVRLRERDKAIKFQK